MRWLVSEIFAEKKIINILEYVIYMGLILPSTSVNLDTCVQREGYMSFYHLTSVDPDTCVEHEGYMSFYHLRMLFTRGGVAFLILRDNNRTLIIFK